jgi:1-phosphofructokinase
LSASKSDEREAESLFQASLPPADASAAMNPRPAAVITFTGNLLAERTFDFAAWAPGQTQRARSESFQVGGKGINVAKMLGRLGNPATALGFEGGGAGAECGAWLRAQGIPWVGVATVGATRTGLVVRSAPRAETTFLGPDAPPDASSVQAAADYLEAQPDGQVLAVCGSIPGWDEAPFDPLREAFAHWAARGLMFVDTYGPPLAWFALRPAALIKINRTEFNGLFSAAEGAAPVADRLRDLGRERPARAWIVTDGPRPVWLGESGGEPRSFGVPPVREISATGSGDVVLAALLHARLGRGLDWPEAVAFALPYAAANAAHPGVADFPLRADLSVEL